MEIQIVAIILGFGAMFVLGMYVATQIEKGISKNIEVKEDDLEAAINNYYDVTEEDEKRMDVIGQNGNDGLHYKDEDKYKDYPRTGGLSPDTGPRN
jgi:hypothetical protein|tara:strand:- start:397 stop:684 length:288 start_codon:yes stop_codon:yes gene_type:complete